MKEMLTFRKFESNAEAEEMAATLLSHNIPSQIEITPLLLDNNFIGKQYDNYVLLKINSNDFEQAQKILIETTPVDIANVEPGYMLLSMSNEELKDIVAKPDEWGEYNYNLALALLQQKGITINEPQLQQMRQQHIAEAGVKRNVSFYWIAFGYAVSLIIILACITNNRVVLGIMYSFYLLPGILGIILGAIIRFTRRTLPDGKHIYSYTDNARKHSLYMILIGIVAFIFTIIKINAIISQG